MCNSKAQKMKTLNREFAQMVDALVLTPEEQSRLFQDDLMYYMVKQEYSSQHEMELDCRQFTTWREHEQFLKKPNWFFSRVADLRDELQTGHLQAKVKGCQTLNLQNNKFHFTFWNVR